MCCFEKILLVREICYIIDTSKMCWIFCFYGGKRDRIISVFVKKLNFFCNMIDDRFYGFRYF